MSDVYLQLGTLGQRLTAIDQQIESLETERQNVKGAIRDLAQKLLDASPDAATERAQVAPRRRRLLAIIDESPDAGYAALTTAFYGKDDRRTRTMLAAELSNMKRGGLVEQSGRGLYHLTVLGRRAADARVLRAVPNPQEATEGQAFPVFAKTTAH